MKIVPYVWDIKWIQPYESPWSIFEKFKYANAISGTDLLGIIGDSDTKNLKSISSAGDNRKDLINMNFFDVEQLKETFGVDLKQFNDDYVSEILKFDPFREERSDLFRKRLTYCPKCMKEGYHSLFHQISFFDYCAFHADERLVDYCLVCGEPSTMYKLDIRETSLCSCSCSHKLVEKDNAKTFFRTWQNKTEVNNQFILDWLKLDKNEISKYHLVYPNFNFENRHNINDREYNFVSISKFVMQAFSSTYKSSRISKVSSSDKVFKIINNKRPVEEYLNYLDCKYPRFGGFKTTIEKAFFFDIYSHLHAIYKVMSRKIKKELKINLNLFNRFSMRKNREFRPILAYDFWKSECETETKGNKVCEKSIQKFDHESFNIQYPIELPFTEIVGESLYYLMFRKKFEIAKLNLTSINYISSKILSHVLIERFISWLEHFKVKDNKEKMNLKTTGIPLFLFLIPKNQTDRVLYYFQNDRMEYLKRLISESTL